MNPDGCVHDNIQCTYITFLSMEAKDLVYEKLFRKDGMLPIELRRYYN